MAVLNVGEVFQRERVCVCVCVSEISPLVSLSAGQTVCKLQQQPGQPRTNQSLLGRCRGGTTIKLVIFHLQWPWVPASTASPHADTIKQCCCKTCAGFSIGFSTLSFPPTTPVPSAGCACTGEPTTFRAESVEVALLCDLHVLWTVWVKGIFATLYYSFGCLRETYVEKHTAHFFPPSLVWDIRLLDYNFNVRELEPENPVFSVFFFPVCVYI